MSAPGYGIVTTATLMWQDVLGVIEQHKQTIAGTDHANLFDLTDHSVAFAAHTAEETSAGQVWIALSPETLREFVPDAVALAEATFFDEDDPDEARAMSSEAMERLLGGKLQSCIVVDLSRTPGSGLLAVRFASLCMERWPCLVTDFMGHIYSSEEVFALRATNRDFEDDDCEKGRYRAL